jgi:hypothetical protein
MPLFELERWDWRFEDRQTEVGLGWNLLPWIPASEEMVEVSCRERPYVLCLLEVQIPSSGISTMTYRWHSVQSENEILYPTIRKSVFRFQIEIVQWNECPSAFVGLSNLHELNLPTQYRILCYSPEAPTWNLGYMIKSFWQDYLDIFPSLARDFWSRRPNVKTCQHHCLPLPFKTTIRNHPD